MHPDFYDWVLEIFRLLHSVLVAFCISYKVNKTRSINQSINHRGRLHKKRPATNIENGGEGKSTV